MYYYFILLITIDCKTHHRKRDRRNEYDQNKDHPHEIHRTLLDIVIFEKIKFENFEA
jgi:hypothetical protein